MLLLAAVANGAAPESVTSASVATPPIPYWRPRSDGEETIEFIGPNDLKVQARREGKTSAFSAEIRGHVDQVRVGALTEEEKEAVAEIRLIQRNPRRRAYLERLRRALGRASRAVTWEADGFLPKEPTTEALLQHNKELGNPALLTHDDIQSLSQAGGRVPEWLLGRSGYEARVAGIVVETPKSELVRGIGPHGYLVGRDEGVGR